MSQPIRVLADLNGYIPEDYAAHEIECYMLL